MNAFNSYINDVNKLIQFQYSDEEIKDISTAVEECIDLILAKVQQLDSRFEVSRILKVGSFYEGTKINSPNEFDYLVQIKELSDPEIISVSSSCADGSVHVSIDKTLIHKWEGKEKNDRVTEEGLFKPQHIQGTFSQLLGQAKAQIKKDPNNEMRKPSGTMSFLDETRDGHPNTAIYLQWLRAADEDILLIGVDITICLSCPESVLAEDIHGINMEVLAQMPDDVRPVIVPPSHTTMASCRLGKGLDGNCCWRISFTPVEVKLMQSLPANHKSCYRILKYFCQYDFNMDHFSTSSLKTLSSYMLKSTILYHNSQCNKTNDTCKCLRGIFDFLMTCSGREFLPNYLMPKQNTWTSNRMTRAVIVPEKILSRLWNLLFEKIEKYTSNYELKTANRLLRNIQKKFKTIELEQFNRTPNLSAPGFQPINSTPLALPDAEH